MKQTTVSSPQNNHTPRFLGAGLTGPRLPGTPSTRIGRAGAEIIQGQVLRTIFGIAGRLTGVSRGMVNPPRSLI